MNHPSLQALLALSALAGPAGATTVLDLSIRDLTQLSEAVVVAHVSDQRVRIERTTRPAPLRPSVQIFTDTELTIERVVWGRAPDRLGLIQPGGSAILEGEPVHHLAHGGARFQPGERVLVFLERADTGQLVVAGRTQGKYTLRTDPGTGALIARRDLGGVNRYGRRDAPRRLAGAPDEDELPLWQLVALIVAKPMGGAGAAPALLPPRLTPQLINRRDREVR